MVWMDKTNADVHNEFPRAARAVNDTLIGIAGDWEADVVIATDDDELFYARAASCQKDLDKVKWSDGLKVICVMRYGKGKTEKEVVFEVMATFQTPQGEDHERELELIVAVLRAWVEEKAFPYARMAISVRDLLEVSDVHDYLEKMNFPAFIRSCKKFSN